MSDLYDVRVTFDTEEGSQAIVDLLMDVFGSSGSATVAQPAAVRREDDRVTVTFDGLAPEPPPAGSEYQPPRPEEPLEAAGRAAIQQLQSAPSEVLVPAVRALVALSAARARAGLPARQHITVEVTAAEPHTQDELRHS